MLAYIKIYFNANNININNVIALVSFIYSFNL